MYWNFGLAIGAEGAVHGTTAGHPRDRLASGLQERCFRRCCAPASRTTPVLPVRCSPRRATPVEQCFLPALVLRLRIGSADSTLKLSWSKSVSRCSGHQLPRVTGRAGNPSRPVGSSLQLRRIVPDAI